MRQLSWKAKRRLSVTFYAVMVVMWTAAVYLATQPFTGPRPNVSREIGRMRPAFVDGRRAPAEWLSPLPDGSIEATGLFTPPVEGPATESGSRVLLGLRVPQRIGPLRVFHVVPLVLDERTEVVFDGQRRNFLEVDEEAGTYYALVRFRPRGDAFHAEHVENTGAHPPALAWPFQVPDANLSDRQLARDAGRPAEPKKPWLYVSEWGSFSLAGYEVGLHSATPPVEGLSASVDVLVPDRLGPSVVYHLVPVFVKGSSGLSFPQPHVADSEAAPPELKTRLVKLERGRLLLTGK